LSVFVGFFVLLYVLFVFLERFKYIYILCIVMKTIQIHIEDEKYDLLVARKGGLNWVDFIMGLVNK